MQYAVRPVVRVGEMEIIYKFRKLISVLFV